MKIISLKSGTKKNILSYVSLVDKKIVNIPVGSESVVKSFCNSTNIKVIGLWKIKQS